jgi:hypothetical protein
LGVVQARKCLNNLAPQVGLEPTTLRLTAECSTIELLRSNTGGQTSLQQTEDLKVNARYAHYLRLLGDSVILAPIEDLSREPTAPR